MRKRSNTNAARDGYYRSLTRKMIAVMILVSVAPLLIISGTILYYFDESYREKALDHLQVLVRKHRRTIDTYLEEKLANIRTLARSSRFDQLTNDEYLEEKLQVLREEYGPAFVDLGMVNDQGIQIAYAGPYRLRDADYSKAEWFKTAIGSDQYISDVFHGLRGHPHFIVAVRREHDGAKWVLRATVDFEAFNSMVERVRVGTTGFAFILNANGEFQTRPRREGLPSTQVYLDYLKSPDTLRDEVRLVTDVDASGNEIIHVMSRMKGGNWLLAYQQGAKDAYSVIHHVWRLSGLIFALGLISIVLMAVVLSKRMVKRIAEADRQKEMMNEQMIEAGKLASLGELAAGIAHEINNPVAIMVEEAGWIGDLLEEEDLKGSKNLNEFQRALEQIRTQGRRCKEITHKLLSFARKTDPAVKPVSMNDLVEDVVALSEQRAKYANVKIVMKLQPDLPQIAVSPSEIQQVLLNLMNNSLDAMDGVGGTIEIVTRTQDGLLVVDVADEGPGVPVANLQRIFDPFFTTKPVGKGTGLGLSICYGIVKKMGGDITVNSAVGLGTTFHVKIPIRSTDDHDNSTSLG